MPTCVWFLQKQDILTVLTPQTTVSWKDDVQHSPDKPHSSENEEEAIPVDLDVIKRHGPVTPSGTGTLTNFLCESNAQRAKKGARMWGWMYEDVEDIRTDLPSGTGTTGPVRTRSHTTPARLPEREPAEVAGKPGAGVTFAADEKLAPEPEGASSQADETHQP